ncbi:MAG: DUF1566 domain-containing protein [Nitrospinales bacterium]
MTETERFVDNGDGTVMDRKTGLMWTRTDTMNDLKKWVNYQEAGDYVRELKANRFAGYDDWRLPGRDEMLTLYDESFSNKDAFGKEIHISGRFAPGGGISMMAQIVSGRPRTFVLSLRDGQVSSPDGLWTLSESARAVRFAAAHDQENMP